MQGPEIPGDWEPGEVRNTRSIDPRLMVPRPMDARPMDPTPTDNRPMGPGLVDNRPIDPRPMGKRSVDPRPIDPQLMDPQPIDNHPIDPRPGPRGPIDPRTGARGAWVEFHAARDERAHIMARLDKTNARLDQFCAATTARLEEQSAVIQELKQMLVKLMKGGGGARHEDRERGVGGVAMGDEKHAQKLMARHRAKMWDNRATRAWWLLSGDRPKNSLQRTELRGLLHKKALVTAAVATQLETLSGLDVGAFLPPGVDLDVATSLLVDRQLRVLGNSIMLVVGEEASNAGRARVSQLGDAFNEGVTLLEDYCMEKLAALQQPEHRRRMVRLVNDDLQAWTTALHGTSAAAGQKWASPPGILELPPAVVPAWTKLRAYINTGVILNDPIPRMSTALPSTSSISLAPPTSRPSIAAPISRTNTAAPNTRVSPSAPASRVSPASPNTRISPAPPTTQINQDGGGRPPAKRPRKEVGVCFQWDKKKTCRWGETCIYSHGGASKLESVGNVKTEPVSGTYAA